MTAGVLTAPVEAINADAVAARQIQFGEFYDPVRGYPKPVFGSEVPRLWTRPLRELTPETTRGYEAINFATVILGVELMPWQRWWLIHALETRADGSFRFRTIVTLISRQNGKTFLLKVLSLYFLYVLEVPLVLGTAQDLSIARESWEAAYDLAAGVPALAAEFVVNPRTKPGRRDGAGYEEIVLTGDRSYRVKATTKKAGRGLSVNLLILDEMRHLETDAWASLSKTTIATPNSLKIGISNAGTDESDVMNRVRTVALSGRDRTIGLFEWSAPDGTQCTCLSPMAHAAGCRLWDVGVWAAGNPGLGYRLTLEALAEALATDPVEVYLTECLCVRVQALDMLVSGEAWRLCADESLTLESARHRVCVCLEVAPDSGHATLVSAAWLSAGYVGVDVVKAWTDLREMTRDLPALLAKINPKRVGWFPSGPAATVARLLRSVKGSHEITGAAVSEVCQQLVGAIARGELRHGGDDLLTAHVLGARKLDVADGYRFARRGSGHVDAAYAMAGAVMLAQSFATSSTDSGVWVV